MFALDHRDGTIINILEKIEQVSFLNIFSGSPCAQRNRRWHSNRIKHHNWKGNTMHFKKTLLIGIFLSISACSDHNREYYEANIDKAELKMNECDASMEATFMSKDEEKLEALSKDVECNIAIKVFNEHKRNLAKIKRELKQRESEIAKKEEEKTFKKEYSEQLVLLKKLPYSDFINLKKDCKPTFMSKGTAKCEALNDLKKERDITEINALKDKYADGKLEAFRDKSCKGVNYSNIDCVLSKQAASQQQQDKIKYYISNRDKLKNDFNQCHKKYIALKKAKKWGEATKSLRTYQCKLVGKAAAKLKVYSFNKPIE